MAELAPPPRSFLIADDHPMVRDALKTALAQAFPGAAMVLAGSLAEVQEALERQPDTDALLLDLDMPGMDGLTGLALLRSDWPTVPIIVVSAARDAAVARRTHDLGASAYVDKSASLEEIAATVRAVLDGEILAPPPADAADSFAQRAAQLTPQQWRVLALMVQGDQNKQIAYKLGVGEATVKAHVTVILRKLGVRSRTQAERRLAVSGHQRSRNRASPGVPKSFDDLQAVWSSVEMQIDQHEVRQAAGARHRLLRIRLSGAGRDAAASAAEQGSHRLAHPGLVVDAEHEAFGFDRRRGLRRRWHDRCRHRGRHALHGYREGRALPRR